MSSNNEDLKQSAFGGMAWTFLERVSTQVVSFAVSVVLARLLIPEDYAPVSIVAIFFAFCNLFINGGLGTALMQKKNPEPEDYSTVLYATLILAAILYGLTFIAAPWIAVLYHTPQLVAILRVMSLSFFVNAFNSVFSSYAYSNLQFKKFFFSSFFGTALSAVVGITMAFCGFGAWALVAQEMTNCVFDTVILYLTTRLKLTTSFSLKRLRSLFQFGWKMFISSVISLIYEQINPIIIGIRFTPADLSFYSKGNSFPSLINNTVSETMASVLFPVMAKVQDNKEDVLNISRRYVKVASYVMFPIMVGLFAVADSFVSFLLTDKWLPAVPFIRIYCISYMFNILQVGNIQSIKAIGRSDVILFMEILKKSLYVFIIGAFVFLSPNAEIMAFSVNACAVVGLTINSLASRKLIGYTYQYQLSDFLPNLVISVIMGAAVMYVGRLQAAMVLVLMVQILIGVMVYVALSILTRNKNFYYLLEIIKSVLKRG